MNKPGVITCKAAVVWSAGDALKIEEIQVDPPKPGEVRIKMVATGICYSDVSASTGKVLGGLRFPMIPGHESSAIVESVGDEKSSFKVGDHVLTVFLPQCKKCRICQHPEDNICLGFLGPMTQGLQSDGTTRMTCRSQPLYTFAGCSTFAEYSVVNEMSLAKINPKAPLEKVCLLSCGFPTGYGAAMNKNAGGVRAGSTCAVFGLGAIGLGAVVGCKNAGAERIIGIDINPEKFKIASELGVTDCVNPNDIEIPLEQYLTEKFDPIQFTFECVGKKATMQCALDSSAIGNGVTTIIGVAETEAVLQVSPLSLLMGKSIKGTLYGGYKSVDAAPKLVEDYLDGKFDLDKFFTHKIKLEQINEGFDLLRSGKSLRTVINFD